MNGLNLFAWAVRNRAAVLFLILISMVAGAFSYESLGRAEDPSFTIKTMVVSAVWPGATADEMQRQVADPIETKIRTLPRLDWVQSYSRRGVSVIQVQLRDDTPPKEMADLFYQVRKKIGDIRSNLPADLRGPFFNDEYSDVIPAVFMLTAPELPQKDLLGYAERFRQRLLRIADVDKVEIVGERPRRIFVDISYTKLATLGIPATAILQAWQQQNTLVPAGSVRFVLDQDRVKQQGLSTTELAQTLQIVLTIAPATQLREDNRLADVVVRAAADERAALDRLGDVTITTRSGTSVPLSQIARLEVAAEQPILWRRNGDVVLSVRSDVVDGVQAPT